MRRHRHTVRLQLSSQVGFFSCLAFFDLCGPVLRVDLLQTGQDHEQLLDGGLGRVCVHLVWHSCDFGVRAARVVVDTERCVREPGGLKTLPCVETKNGFSVVDSRRQCWVARASTVAFTALASFPAHV